MSDWISFEGSIVPMEWGKGVYTVLPLPDEVAAALAAQNAKRVDVELNDHPFNMALTKAPVIDHVFLWAGKSVLEAASVVPGAPIDVRLCKADPDFVEVPSDVIVALRQSGVSAVWEALSAGKRRAHVHRITSAKRAATRAARFNAMIVALQQG